MDDTSGPPAAPQAADMAKVAGLVAGAFFMEMLDGTVITTALPAMAKSFGVGPIDLNLGVTAYLLTLAIFIPLSGWIAERWGAQRTFGAAIALFTFASVLCGISNDLWSFTAARVLQGFGGALMVPVGRLVVLRTTPKSEIVRAIAILTWPGLLAPVLGPPVGGFITAHATWRWIFFLNVPLGMLGLAMTFLLIPNFRAEVQRKLDWTGFFLIALACLSFVYGLSLMGSDTPSLWLPGGLVFAAVIFACLAVLHARGHAFPLLDFSVFGIRTFLVSHLGGSLQRATMSSVPFLLPLMFQLGFGFDPVASGMLLLALFAGNLCMKPATTAMLRRFGFKRVLVVNGLVLAASLAACALLWPSTPLSVIAIVLFIGGASRSMQFTALGTMAFADVPQPLMASANVLATLLQQLAMGAGAALGAVTLRASSLITGTAQTLPSIADFHGAFAIVGALTLLGGLDAAGLGARAGASVSGHR
jgi:EmrB/QacA subfamily drug resistance transporter